VLKVKPGDWVRFYRDGRLDLAIVQYVIRGEDLLGGEGGTRVVLTDAGQIEDSKLLEVRTEQKVLGRGKP